MLIFFSLRSIRINTVNTAYQTLVVITLVSFLLQLRSYAINRQGSTLLSIQPASQGYATFCNARISVADSIVVEHEKLYRENLIATGVSLAALAVFATLAAPFLTYQQYGKIYTYAKRNTGNFRYLLWSFISLCVVGDYLLSFLALFYHVECWTKPHLDSTYKPLYTGALGTWVVVAAIDFVVALAVVFSAKKKDFPAPDLVRYLTCHFTFCPCVGKKVKNTYGIQILAVWHTLAALQIACFHAVFIFVAFIAQPLHTALTMIFYTAMVFCLTTTFMLLYASFHAGHYVSLKRGKFREFCTNFVFGIGQTFVFIFFLFMIVFFGFTFLRITVFVGDTESSRIPGLVGSLLPSVLIAVLGFMAKKLLDSYGEDLEQEADDQIINGDGQDIDTLVMENFSMFSRSRSCPS